MRRIVRDYVTASIDRARTDFERYISQHSECPGAVPLTFTDPLAAIREIRSIKITPGFRADYPPLDVFVTMRVAITARTRRRDTDLGMRTLAVDVEVDAVGDVGGG